MTSTAHRIGGEDEGDVTNTVARRLALPPLAVWVLSACAGTGVVGDDYALIASPTGGLEHVSPTITKRETDREFIERYQWTYRPGGWPAADLVFLKIKDIHRNRLSYVRSSTMPERIEASFPSRDITLGRTGTTSNVLGEVQTQRFRADTVADCIYMQQGISRFADQIEFDSGAEAIGDMLVRGWYCARVGSPDRDRLFREFIASVGIFGYAVP